MFDQSFLKLHAGKDHMKRKSSRCFVLDSNGKTYTPVGLLILQGTVRSLVIGMREFAKTPFSVAY